MSSVKTQTSEESVKRLHLNCGLDVIRKINTLKALTGMSRDKIAEDAIRDIFTKHIAKIAAEEGIIEDTPTIEIKREHFDKEAHPTVFDDICNSLGLKRGEINSVVLEIKSSCKGKG